MYALNSEKHLNLKGFFSQPGEYDALYDMHNIKLKLNWMSKIWRCRPLNLWETQIELLKT